EQIRLLLVIAAVSQEHRAQTELAALRDRGSYGATHHRAADLPGDLTDLQPRVLRFRGIGRAVAEQYVRELVRHDPDDLALGGRGVEHPAVDEHRPAR